MNKALPWNVNGVGFDAREAARDAARRQGKSLGEWLHGVIADHAADLGVDERDVGGQQRIDAVTSKLERLSTRSADHDRRLGRQQDFTPRAGRDDEPPRDRRPRETTGRSRAPLSDESEYLLEEAIDAMERRARRTEQHTTDALNSLARLLERKEADRDRERDAVTDLARKLGDIETRLSENGAAPALDNPIKGALARLESRLDAIGKRSAAEASARQTALSGGKGGDFGKFEEKLDAILDAMNHSAANVSAVNLSAMNLATSSASPAALSAARAAPQERRLDDAVADIARRQRSLDRDEAPVTLRDAILRRRETPARRPEIFRDRAASSTVEHDIASLASRIDDLRRDIIGQRQAVRAPSGDIEGLRAEIAGMTSTLRELAPRADAAGADRSLRAIDGKLNALSAVEPSAITQIQTQMREIKELLAANTQPSAMERLERQLETLGERIDRQNRTGSIDDGFGGSPRLTPDVGAFSKIEHRLEALDAKIDRAVEQPPARGADESLEALVRDLSRRLDAVQAPGADHEAFDALQRQIATLSARFEHSSDGLGKLASLERSMQDIFGHLEQTRTDVEASAARAARDALRDVMQDDAARGRASASSDLDAMKALHAQAEARTSSTLSAVHETLERVVDRLSTMETDIARVRTVTPVAGRVAPHVAPAPHTNLAPQKATPPQAPKPAKRPAPQDIRLGAPDSMFDHALGRLGESGNTDRITPSAGDENRADFIAAARRAAKAAQSDPSVAELKRPAAPASDLDSPVRAGLVEQSRDYVARHKRPVLLGIAALFVVIGTMAIMQRIGFGGGESQVADVPAPASIARMVENTGRSNARIAGANDVLSPSALPKVAPASTASIPGSDPAPTSSITSLPSFAAQGVAQARPGLPNGLSARAKSGDSAAEYVLGMQYAEGRMVPRDFRQAAQWYQKAADQGLAPAKYRLASMYEKGLGLERDKTKAKSLYLEAAEAGNPRAMHNLAVLLADGDGKPDYDGAATWFRKAAQYGIHDSQYNLAILLARGLGVQQSLLQSYQWFAIAATQNDADAAKKRDEVATKLNANDLAVAKALAASFRPRIADIAATEVSPPAGGWDGVGSSSPLNSPRPKISSL